MAIMNTHCVSWHRLPKDPVIINCVITRHIFLHYNSFYDDPDTLPGPAVSGLAT